jgi:hypothetical protein
VRIGQNGQFGSAAFLHQISFIKMKECASATNTEIPETRQRLLRHPWTGDGKSQANGG